MARSGMNPKTLQYLMGHSEIGVTMNVYTHLGLEDAAEELARLQAMEDAKREQEKMGQNTFRIYEPEAICIYINAIRGTPCECPFL